MAYALALNSTGRAGGAGSLQGWLNELKEGGEVDFAVKFRSVMSGAAKD